MKCLPTYNLKNPTSRKRKRDWIQ